MSRLVIELPAGAEVVYRFRDRDEVALKDTEHSRDGRQGIANDSLDDRIARFSQGRSESHVHVFELATVIGQMLTDLCRQGICSYSFPSSAEATTQPLTAERGES